MGSGLSLSLLRLTDVNDGRGVGVLRDRTAALEFPHIAKWFLYKENRNLRFHDPSQSFLTESHSANEHLFENPDELLVGVLHQQYSDCVVSSLASRKASAHLGMDSVSL